MEPASNKIQFSDGDLQWLSQKFGALEDLNTTFITNSKWYKSNFQNQSTIAIKVTQLDSKKHLNKLLSLSEELMGLTHYNLLRIYSIDYITQGEDRSLVALGFQLGEESLKTRLTKPDLLKVKDILITLYSAAQLLDSVKSAYNLHHGTIKSSNLIKFGSLFKLSEFGDGEDIQRARSNKDFKICAKLINNDENDHLKISYETLQNEYLSPEIRNNRCLSSDEKEEMNELFANDVYSLGILLLEMFGNHVHKLRQISPDSAEYATQLKIYKEVVQSKGGIPLRELTDRMLDPNPKQRITIGELVDCLKICACKMGCELEKEIEDLISAENTEDDSSQKFMNHIQGLNKKLLEAQNLIFRHKLQEALVILDEHLIEIEKMTGLEEKKGQNLRLRSRAFLEMGKTAKATELSLEALALYDNLFGKENITSANILHHLADCYSQLGDKQKAIDAISKSLEITKSIKGERSHGYATLLSFKGIYHNDKAEFTQALKDLNQTQEIFEELSGKKSIEVADTLGTIAIVHKTMRNYERALECIEQAAALHKELKCSDLETMYSLYLNLGAVKCSLARYQDAIKDLLKAIEIGEKLYGIESLILCSALSNIGGAYTNIKDFGNAAKYLERGLEIRKKYLPPDSLKTAISLGNVADLYSKTGRVAEAKEMFEKTVEIRKNKLGEDHPDTAHALANLAKCFHLENQFEKAVECYDKAISIQKKFFKDFEIQHLIRERDRAKAHQVHSEARSSCRIF